MKETSNVVASLLEAEYSIEDEEYYPGACIEYSAGLDACGVFQAPGAVRQLHGDR